MSTVRRSAGQCAKFANSGKVRMRGGARGTDTYCICVLLSAEYCGILDMQNAAPGTGDLTVVRAAAKRGSYRHSGIILRHAPLRSEDISWI